MALPKDKLHDVTSQKITLLTNLRKKLKITSINFVFNAKFYRIFLYLLRGHDTSVGRATHYELDDSLFESRYGDKEFYLFFTTLQTSSGAHPAFFTMGSGGPSRVNVSEIWR